jgi:YggT family protein
MSVLVLVLGYLRIAITVATVVLASALLLRMILQWAQVNPFGWFALNLRRVTEPVMRPFRYGFDNRMLRFDMMPIVAAALVLLNGLFAAWVVGQVEVVLADFAGFRPVTPGLVIGDLVWLAVVAYMALLFARFLLPMLGFGYSSGFLRFAYQVTEPVLKPLRRYLVLGAFDLSPLVVLFVLQFVGVILRNLLIQM